MQEIVIKSGEKKDVVLVWMGEDNVNDECRVVLEGDGSEASVVGVFLGRGSYKYKNYVTVVHKGENTKADVYARGVVLDESRVDFSGMLRVEHGAKGTSTYFNAQFMVLSPKAGAHTFPGLEIHENDISKGGHAATVAQVRDEDIFYLMSRGLSRYMARDLMVKGFFEPVLKLIPAMQQNQVRFKVEELLGNVDLQ
jgi:Fe-S cluster assembly scaffold protein SufB